jgi:hypothetical protein
MRRLLSSLIALFGMAEGIALSRIRNTGQRNSSGIDEETKR